MIETKDLAPDRRANRCFVKARQKHFYSLYCHYTRTNTYPFFVDISGPSQRMSFTQFVEYCTEDNATLLVAMNQNIIGGFVLLSDIQLDLELANLDFCFFESYPVPDSAAAHLLKATLARIMTQNALTRLQMLVLEIEKAKIDLLKWLEFEIEGTLREHFFFSGAHHNLAVFSRTETARHDL